MTTAAVSRTERPRRSLGHRVAVAALALVRATGGRLGLADEQSTKPQRTSGDFGRSMLTHGVLALVAVVAAAALAGSAGAAVPQPAAASPAEIDRFIEREIDARRVPGYAVAVVRGTEVVHVRGFGTADGSGRAVTADTPFVLGSTTKSFTALAVMQLVDAGDVSLDAPIARYVPELRLAEGAERRITVRQLLNQTSGIPGLAGGRLLRSVGDGTLEDVVAELNGTEVIAAPGTRFEYANANFVLLGLVIERTSGLSYGDYVEQRIFAPLGMRHSFANPEAAHAAGLAVGHRYWFGFAVAHGPTSPDSVRPAGYLMSSARDMGRYLAMFSNGGELDGRRLVSAAGLRTLLAPVASTELGPWADSAESRYAMGWFVGGPWSAPALLHPGRGPDSSAMIVLLPQMGLGVVTLTNASLELPLPGGASSLQRTARGVVSLLVGEEPEPGISFARFYVIFDAVVVLTLAALVWSLVRLLHRRHRDVHGWRLAARSLRAVAEVGAGTLLLALPAVTGQGWAAAMLWWPDLALVVLVLGGLLMATGAARAVALTAASRRRVQVRPAPVSVRPRGASAAATATTQPARRGPRSALPRRRIEVAPRATPNE